MNSSVKVHVIRLKPKEDLKKSIMDFARKNAIQAGIIVTCVGSLERYTLRFANRKDAEVKDGFFEIVSLVGTFSSEACHLHISVSDSAGATTGGHLLDGNVIYTTAEIALATLPDLVFSRALDETYGFPELAIKKNL
jgi:uncharacterized protein